MLIRELADRLHLKIVVGGEKLDAAVTGGYACDLLSNVMANATAGMVWVTVQGHQNIVAVASLTEIAAVIITGGAVYDQQTIEKANQEGVVLLATSLSTFETVGRLYGAGIKNL